MQLINAPVNEAIVSNVGEIGEFRIRNSAKAFNILSSGLYANKIRAIIRELSCNAIDSHVAAGNTNAQFEVHLPNDLEPYFSVRDFGTGLNHDQVTQIYTTYFESTKTDSNAFIGALGLGSKSPFSYTDNFTVTAIKDGKKRIYTAFINDMGVPSIALMDESDTSEANGVEVRFAVTESWDYSKFADEATIVYRWFKQRPIITGRQITIDEINYETKDIIPGVSLKQTAYGSNGSHALMGNIAYPIEVPNAEKSLGEVYRLLSCGLVMEFDIGELDFQASREGLSYIPQTINAIKKKLEALNSALSDVVAAEADAIENLWERSQFLYQKKSYDLYRTAVVKYVADTNFPLFEGGTSYWGREFTLDIGIDDLAALNISIAGFTHSRNSVSCAHIKPHSVSNGLNATSRMVIGIDVNKNTFFIENDTKIGGLERAKYHFRENNDPVHYSREGYVLSKIDKEQDMNIDAFYEMIFNPPEAQRLILSELDEKPKNVVSAGGNRIAKNVTILRMTERGGYSWHSRSKNMVWREAGNLTSFDDTKTYYYIPLTGFKPELTKLKLDAYGIENISELVETLKDTDMDDFKIQVYGVRKSDLSEVQSKANWVLLENYIETTLKRVSSLVNLASVSEHVDKHDVFLYNTEYVAKSLTAKKSVAKNFFKEFAGLPKMGDMRYIRDLMKAMDISAKGDLEQLVDKYKTLIKEFDNRYPLIDKLYNAKDDDVIHYINLVDSVKKV